MRYGSSQTACPDAYRAGIAIGEGLEQLAPEVVMLFLTTQYLDRMHEIGEGVHDVLGREVRLCGCTGDGIYGPGVVTHQGISALGMHGEGRVCWSVGLERGVRADAAHAAAEAVRRARRDLAGPVVWACALADGVQTDGSQLVAGLSQELSIPYVGGLAGDDRQFKSTAVLADNVVSDDAVVVLLASGDLPFRLHAASGWTPIGGTGLVTAAEGTHLNTVDGRPATQFIAEQTGRELGAMDLGVVPLAEYTAGDAGDHALRAPSGTDILTGAVNLFGRVKVGSSIRVCRASMDDIVHAVDTALAGAQAVGFIPKAAIIVSCAGRKWLLSEGGREEVEKARRTLGDIPLVGFLSFGEIGPFHRDGTYSHVLFHNMTFVVCLLG